MEKGSLKIKLIKIILIIIGIIIIFDGIISMILNNDPYLFQIGRIIRIFLGIVIIICSFYIDKEITIIMK